MRLGRLLDRAYWAGDRLAFSLRRRGLGGTVRFGLRRAGLAPAPPRASLVEQYARLEARWRLDGRERARLAKEAARLPWRPLVSVVAEAGPGTPLALSLEAQVYAPLELVPSLSAARGEVVGFLRPGDELAPDAVYRLVRLLDERRLDVVYADHDLPAPGGREPVLKPDWSPELFRRRDYVDRAWLARRAALGEPAAGAEEGRLPRSREAQARIGREPRVLFRLDGPGHVSGSGAALEAVRGEPLVSIVIPTRDGAALLRRAVESLESRTGYRRFELVLIDNGSAEPEAVRYLAELASRHRVLRDDAPFNWSALNDLGARHARGELLLFLNNDVEVVEEGWLAALVAHAQRAEVGAVGARLLYADRTIQHAGIIVGQGGIAGHPFRHAPADAAGPFFGPAVARNWSAVTGACLMTRREVFDALGGFDERLPVAYNDVDFCLRAGERGLRVVYEPAATLLHHESASRSRVDPWRDTLRFQRRWRAVLPAGDPYGHPLLDLTRPEGDIMGWERISLHAWEAAPWRT